MLIKQKTSLSKTFHLLLVVTFLLVFCSIAYNYTSALNDLGFYAWLNIAFDFDQAAFMKAVDGSYTEAITDIKSIWIKHPLTYLYSYITSLLQFIGFSRFHSVAIICLVSISLSLFLMWKTFILITKDTVISFLLLILLASSASVSSISIVFDSYTLLSTWIALTIFLFCSEYYENRRVHSLILAIVYVMLVGVTVYMILLILFIELFKAINNTKSANANLKVESKRLLILISQCLIFGIALMFITYPEQFLLLLNSPLDYFKRVLWAVIRPGEQATVSQVLYILFANGLIAPTATLVPIPDGFSMFDLRSLRYSLLQSISLVIIYIAMVLGIFNKKYSVTLPFAIFLLISFIFHIEYHDRGSLFLYSSHFIFPIFICIAAGLKTLKSWHSLVTKFLLIAVIIISTWSSMNMLTSLNTHSEAVIKNYNNENGAHF